MEMKNGKPVLYLGKTDLTSTFHILCMNRSSWRWLIFKAVDPADGKVKYFVDKCLPFWASISCSHYQRFSNSIKHILKFKMHQLEAQLGKLNQPSGMNAQDLTNYLDDFLFLAVTKWLCNFMIQQFLTLCEEINLPVAEEKTEWTSTLVIFLGILLNGAHLLLSLPLEKQQKALRLLNNLLGKKKITVKQ